MIQLSSNAIIGGHQRVRAAIALKLETIPMMYLDLDDDYAKALNVALNRIHGEFDTKGMKAALADLDDRLKTLTGLTPGELSKINEGFDLSVRDRIEELEPRPAPAVAWFLIGVPRDKAELAREHIAAGQHLPALPAR